MERIYVYSIDIRENWRGGTKGNRQIGNDAIRLYMQLIDLDRHNIAGQISICPKCELEMD